MSLAPGFADPVFDSQQIFRILLNAMSRPAQTLYLPSLSPAPDAACLFSASMAALALSLCDNQTPIWLQPEVDSEAVRHYLRFHCGAVFTDKPEQAAFAFIAQPETMPALSTFAQGTVLYPEQSSTLVVATSLSAGPRFAAQGPGIGGAGEDQTSFVCTGVPAQFWRDWTDSQRAFPLGVDVLFVDESAHPNGALLMGLPRTTTVCAAAHNEPENLTCMSL